MKIALLALLLSACAGVSRADSMFALVAVTPEGITDYTSDPVADYSLGLFGVRQMYSYDVVWIWESQDGSGFQPTDWYPPLLTRPQQNPQPVNSPEPGTWWLGGLGLAVLAFHMKR